MKLGYLPPAKEVASAAVWLLSDEAAHAVGTVIDVTNGV
jgi:hypothetical protein